MTTFSIFELAVDLKCVLCLRCLCLSSYVTLNYMDCNKKLICKFCCKYVSANNADVVENINPQYNTLIKYKKSVTITVFREIYSRIASFRIRKGSLFYIYNIINPMNDPRWFLTTRLSLQPPFLVGCLFVWMNNRAGPD